MDAEILIVDRNGTPRAWANHEEGCCYFSRDKVVWTLGDIVKVYTGGKNHEGKTSRIEVPAIMGVTGPIVGQHFYDNDSKFAERRIIYGRDLFTCAYCLDTLPAHKLTIDHIKPKAQGGENTWTNCITACKPCNTAKGNKTPDQWGHLLMFLPYVPSRFEKILLKGRNVLQDQMEFLMGRIPKTSRMWKH